MLRVGTKVCQTVTNGVQMGVKCGLAARIGFYFTSDGIHGDGAYLSWYSGVRVMWASDAPRPANQATN